MSSPPPPGQVDYLSLSAAALLAREPAAQKEERKHRLEQAKSNASLIRWVIGVLFVALLAVLFILGFVAFFQTGVDPSARIAAQDNFSRLLFAFVGFLSGTAVSKLLPTA